MSETSEISKEEMSKITRRVFGRAGTKACADPDVIRCMRFACQKANRCMLKLKKNQKKDAVA